MYTLHRNLIKSEIYPRNWVLVDNVPREVQKVNEKSIVVHDDDGNLKRLFKTDVENSIIKYTAQQGKKIFDLSFSDYHLAHGKHDNLVDGYTFLIKTKARIGDTVRIDCLKTVDRYNLYEKDARFGTIIDRDRNFFTIEMSRTSDTIKLHRTAFILVNEKDSKIFFRLICDRCHR